MRSSKDRKHTKKRVNKALATKKTEESRARRLSNKVLREAIHNIDPNLKVKIVNQRTYIDNDHLVEVEVVNGKIKPTEDAKDKAYNAIPINFKQW